MSINLPTKGGGDYERPTVGMHQAVCSHIYGPFESSYEWQGKKIEKKKVIFLFELDQTIEKGDFAGKRFTVSKDFTASLREKSNLRPFVVAWAGKAFNDEDQADTFDIETLIGKNCNLNLIEKPKRGGGKTIIIASIVPRIKGQEEMTPELPADYIPKWIAERMGVALEDNHQQSPDNFEDDIPF